MKQRYWWDLAVQATVITCIAVCAMSMWLVLSAIHHTYLCYDIDRIMIASKGTLVSSVFSLFCYWKAGVFKK